MKIPFINKRKYSYLLSLILIVASVSFLALWGLKPGIDFVGGSLLEVGFNQVPLNSEVIQDIFSQNDLGQVNIQPSDENKVIMRFRNVTEKEHQIILNSLVENFKYQDDSENVGEVISQLRFESVGPVIGQELRDKAMVAIILTLIFIIIFIAYAFRKVSYPIASWKYGLAALIALAHDIIILCGIFAVLGQFLGYEVNILFITALLTTLGYSVNDTIVVFDRTRENLFKHKDKNFSEVVNESLNQTLIRSINTSFTTLLVLFAIFLFGGETIKEFVLALIIGTIAGTYSSIFLASPLLVDWHRFSLKRNE